MPNSEFLEKWSSINNTFFKTMSSMKMCVAKKLEHWDLAQVCAQLDQLKYLLLSKLVCIKKVDQGGKHLKGLLTPPLSK